MDAFMMITALAWPMIGGAVVGLVGGLVRRHGLVGTIIDLIVGGVAGFALTMGLTAAYPRLPIPSALDVPLAFGFPVLGGLLGLWLKGRFASA